MNFEDLATKHDVESLKNSIDLLMHTISVNSDKDEVLTLQEGAALIKMPFSTFKKKVAKKLIPSSKIGKVRTVLKSDVLKLWKTFSTPSRLQVSIKNGIF